MPIFGVLILFLLLLVFLFCAVTSAILVAIIARVAFKPNLETATLNPADSSAHYNLGLIHQQRGDLKSNWFQRAVKLARTIDAHFLGRIAAAVTIGRRFDTSNKSSRASQPIRNMRSGAR